MIGGGQFVGVGLPLLGGVALDERLVERPADQRDGLLLEVLRVGGVDLGGLLRDQRARLVGREVLAEELRHQAQSHRELVGLPVVHREHPVLVVGEVGELPHVVPHPLVGGVEQVGAVLVDLDAGLRLGLGVGVAADVGPPVDARARACPSWVATRSAIVRPKNPEPTTRRSSGRRAGAKRPGNRSGHRQQGYPTARRTDPHRDATRPRSMPHATASKRPCARRRHGKVAIRSRFRIVTLVTPVTPVPSNYVASRTEHT